MAESEELLLEKIKKWKVGMEEKELRVNVGKTKVMRCQEGAGQVAMTGKYPCGVCGKGVGSNSIKCTSCNAWFHKKCSVHRRYVYNGEVRWSSEPEVWSESRRASGLCA